MTRRTPRRGKGTLHVIAGLLAVSALVRLGDAGQAMAQEPAALPDAPVPTAVVEALTGTPEDLLRAFQEREARLAAREAQLADRLVALQVAEELVADQLAALEAAEAELSATIARAETASESDIGTLVSVYENMKPKDAGAMFEQMTPEFAAGFLALMSPESAAQIMGLLPSDRAHAISVVLAGRNVGVPTQ